MKRPAVVWIVCILIAAGILWQVLVSVFIILSGVGLKIGSAIIQMEVIPWAILVINFLQLKKKSELWVHISFGLAVVSLIASIPLIMMGGLKAILLFTILLLFCIFMWWAIVSYIKKKQIDGKPLFN
jgi:hypothetical protein